MKLKLPIGLKMWLAAASCVGVTCFTVKSYAEVMSYAVPTQIYMDMANNMGIYQSGSQNVQIIYNADAVAWTLAQMPDFSSVCDSGAFGLVSPNMTASVAHNGAMSGGFSKRYLGDGSKTLKYRGVEVRGDSVFGWNNSGTDFKVDRLNKLVTDAVAAPVCLDSSILSSLTGRLVYRAGGGTMAIANADGTTTSVTGGYAALAAGISTISSGSWNTSSGVLMWAVNSELKENQLDDGNPLPFYLQGGDSGSPSFIWNENTQRYEYLGAGQAIGGASYFKGNNQYVANVQDATMVKAGLDAERTSVIWSAATQTGVGADLMNPMLALSRDSESSSTVAYNGDGSRVVSVTSPAGTANLYAGTISDGTNAFEYVGVNVDAQGSTWKNINLEKDNWYAYDVEMQSLTGKDVFFTTDIRLTAAAVNYDVLIDGRVDTGIGAVTFDRGGMDEAVFTLRQANASSSLDTAGMIINKGVTVISELTGSSDEWRAVGDGEFRIRGHGDNYIGLNTGNGLSTILEREGGYGAYNVLLNTGASVTIRDAGQIGNNLTFGNGGGTLDMNGNSLAWTSNGMKQAGDANFAMTMLTEDAVIANYKNGSTATLTYSLAGNSTLAGSFRDNGSSSLKVVYNSTGVMTWNSVNTSLTGAGSGLVVQNGKVILAGSLTRHAGITNITAYKYYDDDWHYANAVADVTVKNGASFELGSHARLEGDVTVESGGTFIMREGVMQQMECVEGWYVPVDVTSDLMRTVYGLKGNVSLASGASMVADFGAATVAQVYAGTISGAGGFTKKGAGAELILSGTNTFSGSKTLESGALYAASQAALGDCGTNRWVMRQGTMLGVGGDSASAAAILGMIDGSSSGVFVLDSSDGTLTNQLNFSGHQGLFLGAREGKTLVYGTQGTMEALQAVNGAWRLGGGGGSLVVNYRLSGANNLTVGSQSGFNAGRVVLANVNNDFSGTVTINGSMILESGVAALGQARVDLAYGTVLAVDSVDAAAMVTRLQEPSAGILALKSDMAGPLDMSSRGSLSLGSDGHAVFSGRLTASDDGYRLGGMGTLVMDTVLDGALNLTVDGQGRAGSKVVLAQAATLTGDVVVRGRRAGDSGSVVLQAGTDHALDRASSVALHAGGTLDANGHTLVLNNLTGQAGGLMTNSGNGKAAVTLNYGSNASLGASIEGNMDVVQTGSGTLSLTGAVNLDGTWALQGGALSLLAGSSFAADRLIVGHGSVLGAAGNVLTRDTNVYLDDGAVLTSVASGTVNVTSNVTAGSGTSVWNLAAGQTMAYGGGLLVNGTLNKTGAGTLLLTAIGGNAGSLSGNGTIHVQGGVLQLGNSKTINPLEAGTVQIRVGNGAALNLNSSRTIYRNELVMENGGTFRILDGTDAGSVADPQYKWAGNVRLESGTANMVLSYGKHTEFTGTISGAGALNIRQEISSESPKLILSGNNTYAGGTAITGLTHAGGGIEVYVNNRAALGTGNVALTAGKLVWMGNYSGMADGASLTFGGAAANNYLNTQAYDVTLNGSLIAKTVSGTTMSGFIKTGSGTLALAGDSSGYSGSIAVREGELKIAHANALGNGSVTFMSGTTLDLASSATLGGRLTLNNGVTVSTSQGTTLTLNGGYTQTGKANLAVDFLAGAKGSGAYLLIDKTDSSGSAFNFELVNLADLEGTRMSAALRQEQNRLYLDFVDNRAQAVWRGSSGAAALTMGVADSAHLSTSAADSVLKAYDYLTIDQQSSGGGASHVLTLAQAGIRASSVTVQGADHYTINGGSLSGGTSLVKLGSGTLTLASSNDYSGGSSIRGGTVIVTGTNALGSGIAEVLAGGVLQAGASGALGSTDIVLSGGTLTGSAAYMTGSGAIRVNESGVLKFTAGGTAVKTLDVGDSLLTVNTNGYAVTWNAAINGSGTLVKTGTNTLTFDTNVKGWNGNIRIEQGTLKLGSFKTGAPSIGSGDIRVEAGATLAVSSDPVTYANNLSFAHTANFSVPDGNNTGTMAVPTYKWTGSVTLDGVLNMNLQWGKITEFSGVIRDGASGRGSIVISQGSAESSLLILSGQNTFSGDITLASGKTQLFASNRQALGRGNLLLNSGELVWYKYDGGFDAGVVLGGGSLRVDGGNAVRMDSTVRGGNLVKTGGGSLTLAGDVAYTGTTTVRGGELIVDRSTATVFNNDVVTGDSATAYGVFSVKSDAVINGGLGGYGVLNIGDGATLTLNSQTTNVEPSNALRRYYNSVVTGGGTLEVTQNVLAFYAAKTRVDPRVQMKGGTLSLGGATTMTQGVNVTGNASVHFREASATLTGPASVSAGSTLAVGGSAGTAVFTGGTLAFSSLADVKFVLSSGAGLELNGSFLLDLSGMDFSTDMLKNSTTVMTLAATLDGGAGSYLGQELVFTLNLATGLTRQESWLNAAFSLDAEHTPEWLGNAEVGKVTIKDGVASVTVTGVVAGQGADPAREPVAARAALANLNVTPTPVPEPAGASLIMLGAAGLFLGRRRR